MLAAGQETLSRLLAEGVAAGLENASAAMTPFNRELGPRLEAVIATSGELQERAVLKRVGMASAIADALRDRGVDESSSFMAAELGVLAFKVGFDEWIADGNEAPLAALTSAALDRFRMAMTRLD